MSSIKVFEHTFLQLDDTFQEHHLIALSKLNTLHQDKYFSIRHNGILFKQFVGVIQVDGLTIEILPKIDNHEDDTSLWHKALIEMLRVTRKLKVQQVGEADVKKQQIHLLDIYFDWFLNEVQLLLHQGLIKQYYKETSNVKALKGKLEFAGHISKNLVHKERFYTTHQVYDKDHLIHQVLYKALDIVEKCSKGSYRYSKCKTVQLDFPEVQTISVNEATFTKLPKNRKTAPYETAISIARLIILNYAPNISSGNERMLALLFDMNSLWEEYVLARLKQVQDEYGVSVYGQQSKPFWSNISIRPDIVIKKKLDDSTTQTFIIDTKWKNISNALPSTQDLRQMYVYNDYWKSQKAILLYPSADKPVFSKESFVPFVKTDTGRGGHTCALGRVSIFNHDNRTLNKHIGDTILEWFDLKKTTSN